MKIKIVETIQSYFTRVSEIKEQLEAVDEEVGNADIVMTTLNSLPRSWDSFIQGICARKKLVKFSRLWEECTKEENMGSEDQALTVHSKKRKRRPHYSKGKDPHHRENSRRDLSKLRCYT